MPRFTIDMDETFNNTLAELAHGTTKADVIRRAVASYSYLKSQVPTSSADKQISITDKHGNVEKVVILP